MKRELRCHPLVRAVHELRRFEACPDEGGIKTARTCSGRWPGCYGEKDPDEEGIETAHARTRSPVFRHVYRGFPMRRGLRQRGLGFVDCGRFGLRVGPR